MKTAIELADFFRQAKSLAVFYIFYELSGSYVFRGKVFMFRDKACLVSIRIIVSI